MEPLQECPILSDLRERCAEARKLYGSAVAALDRMELAEEEATIGRVESARLLYLKARAALKEHQQDHGCGLRQDSN